MAIWFKYLQASYFIFFLRFPAPSGVFPGRGRGSHLHFAPGDSGSVDSDDQDVQKASSKQG